MGRCGEICIAQLVAGEPIVFGEQRVDIGEMIGKDFPDLSEHRMVQWSTASFERHVLLISLTRNWAADIGKKLVVKPTCKSAHLDPQVGGTRQESTVAKITAVNLVNVLSDSRSSRSRCSFVNDQNRNSTGGIEE